MKFGTIPVDQAEGAILAHATTAGDKRFRKAHRVTADDIAVMKAAGIDQVAAAVLEPDDLDEDAASGLIAASVSASHIETKPPANGRVNFHAEQAGVFVVDRALIDAVNRLDPTITLATVEPFAAVTAGQMVATIKIIPFAIPRALAEKAAAILSGREVFSVHPFTPRRVGVAQTMIAGTKPSVLDKTVQITAARLERSGSRISRELRTAHDEAAVAEAIGALAPDSDVILVFGASAICDDDDVIPAAIRRAGGRVERVGMPVDPGNLLALGWLGKKPVLGAPGCARSPKLNGFDWVLDRLAAGLEVTRDDIADMGVGGLLMEIPTRPQPREPAKKPADTKVWAVLLAAGRSRRMEGGNKLLADFGGMPLVRRTAARVAAAKVAGAVAVLGHQADRVASALSGLDIRWVDNPDFASGIASSLKAGIRALPEEAAGALVVLADMPEVATRNMNDMIEAFAASGGKAIVRATHGGKRGNPVLLPRVLFAEVEQLSGDTGARQVVETSPLETIEVEIGAAASLDVDTPEALREAGGVLVE